MPHTPSCPSAAEDSLWCAGAALLRAHRHSLRCPPACRLLSRHPLQISQLSRLQALGLHLTSYTSEGYAPLTALPALRRLSLERATVPTCLSQLTRLEALSVWDELGEGMEEEEANLLAAGLPHLTRLTHLVLSAGAGQAAAALSSLPRLQTLFWEDEQSLPPGPYLRSLQRLDTTLPALLASVPALAGAAALETIGLHCGRSSPHQLAAALCCADCTLTVIYRLPAGAAGAAGGCKRHTAGGRDLHGARRCAQLPLARHPCQAPVLP